MNSSLNLTTYTSYQSVSIDFQEEEKKTKNFLELLAQDEEPGVFN